MKVRAGIWIKAVLSLLVPALGLALGLRPTQKANAAGVDSTPAQSTARILDHRSGEGYRLADHRWTGDEEFTTPLPAGYGPGQIRHAYGFDALANDGQGQVIGIVWAFHYPTAAADLQHFIRTFGLQEMYGLPDTEPCTLPAGPHPCFQVVYGSGTQPAVDPAGSHLEYAIDIQWAHAIAQGADILMVEAPTNSFADLLVRGVDVAASQGATVVSMSWGVPEAFVESLFDHHFNITGVSFIASSGDSGHGITFYPAASPFVLSVGGTTLHLDSKGRRTGPETAWSGSTGGISPFEQEPGYQSGLPIPNTGGYRGMPDVALNADSATGQAVFDSTPVAGQTGWFVVGGTSISAPEWAGLAAMVNEGLDSNLSSGYDLQNRLYGAAAPGVYKRNYYDIISGSNGTCGSICQAGPGYDFVTGLGTPRANNLVPFLAGRNAD